MRADDGPDDLLESPPEPPIVPGRPDPENVLFVALGMLLALGVVGRVVVLLT